jgi:type IV pilus assembly protein PilY1
MLMKNSLVSWAARIFVAIAWLLVATMVMGGTVTVSKTPPGVTSKVAPNIVVTFDDSGSMNSTSIPDTMDANYNNKYYYSALSNPIYFDPTVTYVVPPDASGMPLGTPTFKAAWRDGYCANTLTRKCWSPGNSKYLDPTVVDLSTAFYAGFLANIQAGNYPCSRNANELNTWLISTSNGNTCQQMDIPASVRGTTSTTTSSSASSNSTCALFCGDFNGVNGTKTTTSTVTNTDGSVSVSVSVGNCTTVIVTKCNIVTTVTTTSIVTVRNTGGFYYVCTAPANDTTCTYHLVANESAAIQQNFAIWYSYYRSRNLNARAAVGRVFSGLADGSVRVAWQTLQTQTDSGSYNTSATGYTGFAYGPLGTASKILELGNGASCVPTSVTDTCWRSQFMNWLYGAPASGGTPTRVATQVAGDFYKRKLTASTPALDPYWNGSTSTPGELTCRKNFNMLVTDGYWNGDKPATGTSNDNVALTLPDGTSYSVTSDTTSKVFWNQDGTTNPSLADIAFSYWANDLRTDLVNNVPAYYSDLTTGVTAATATVDLAKPGATREVYFNPANDPATWQHMSQYMVTMGISGSLTYPTDYAALRKGTKTWPLPVTTGGATNIDDTWHAALNSRGGYFSAADPTSLVNSLTTILSSVIASSSSALTLSLSANVLTTNAIAYYAGYNTTDWSGSLIAKAIASNGTVGASVWPAGDAGTQLTARAATDRFITTSTGPGTGTAITFAYTTLSTTEKAALDSSDGTGSTATTDNLGAKRVDWLSGVRTLEGTTFRTRSSLLGAIFGSQPAYVGPPNAGYGDAFSAGSPEAAAVRDHPTMSYSTFLAKWASRPPVVYVGANDGMLHAFDARLSSVSGATPGRELWAHIPASVYPNLPAQTRLTNFSFTPTVDGSPVTGDVFFNGPNTSNNTTMGWHTLLVGSLRLGGRGVFGVDITDPSGATLNTSTAVASRVLWEFNSDSVATTGTPANLGYTFGTPVIARVAYDNGTAANTIGRWVVLVPGGYFPDGSTAAAASNTYSSLFVLDAQTGTLLKEIRTPTGTGAIASHGLTTPAVGDYGGDQVADVAFAGDLDGNVWRIDLSTATLATTTASQGVSLLFKPATANAQSITTSPRLLADPTSTFFMVIFGTGRYLSTADTSDTTTQALYGVRDPGTSVASPITVAGGNLVAQTMVLDATSGAIGVTSNVVPATRSGWYLLLNTAAGERVVVTPALDSSNNTVTFSTLIPTASDPCTTSSSGSIIALDGTTGGAAFGVSIGSTTSFGSGYTLAGAHVLGAASSGSLYTAASLSGGTSYLPGQIPALGAGGTPVNESIPTARRRSWRILNGEN